MVFPKAAPREVGIFTCAGPKVTFQPAPGVTVTRDGQPFAGGPVQTDEGERAKPDVLQVGRFRFQLIVRGTRIGVRIKDPEARAGATALAGDLDRLGVEVLLDDRQASPGVKFKDAELLGVPWIVLARCRAPRPATGSDQRRSPGAAAGRSCAGVRPRPC